MWEVGFAMARTTPVILVSYGEIDPHFDLHDVQQFKYRRTQLRRTLTDPLRNAVEHTARHLSTKHRATNAPVESGSGEALCGELHKLKAMVREIMGELAPARACARHTVYQKQADAHSLTGARRNTETGNWI